SALRNTIGNTTIIPNTPNNPHLVNFDASRVVPTASENRPRSIAFNYIVRAA
ncbi:TPA: phage tail protein, partial [Escherichia coli]